MSEDEQQHSSGLKEGFENLGEATLDAVGKHAPGGETVAQTSGAVISIEHHVQEGHSYYVAVLSTMTGVALATALAPEIAGVGAAAEAAMVAAESLGYGAGTTAFISWNGQIAEAAMGGLVAAAGDKAMLENLHWADAAFADTNVRDALAAVGEKVTEIGQHVGPIAETLGDNVMVSINQIGVAESGLATSASQAINNALNGDRVFLEEGSWVSAKDFHPETLHSPTQVTENPPVAPPEFQEQLVAVTGQTLSEVTHPDVPTAGPTTSLLHNPNEGEAPVVTSPVVQQEHPVQLPVLEPSGSGKTNDDVNVTPINPMTSSVHGSGVQQQTQETIPPQVPDQTYSRQEPVYNGTRGEVIEERHQPYVPEVTTQQPVPVNIDPPAAPTTDIGVTRGPEQPNIPDPVTLQPTENSPPIYNVPPPETHREERTVIIPEATRGSEMVVTAHDVPTEKHESSLWNAAVNKIDSMFFGQTQGSSGANASPTETRQEPGLWERMVDRLDNMFNGHQQNPSDASVPPPVETKESSLWGRAVENLTNIIGSIGGNREQESTQSTTPLPDTATNHDTSTHHHEHERGTPWTDRVASPESTSHVDQDGGRHGTWVDHTSNDHGHGQVHDDSGHGHI